MIVLTMLGAVSEILTKPGGYRRTSAWIVRAWTSATGYTNSKAVFDPLLSHDMTSVISPGIDLKTQSREVDGSLSPVFPLPDHEDRAVVPLDCFGLWRTALSP